MIVTKALLPLVLNELAGQKHYGIDVESYGKDYIDRLFSIGINCSSGSFYFNFHDYGDGSAVLDYDDIAKLSVLFEDPETLVFAHNAKFDLHKLAHENLIINCKVHCTMAAERMLYNAHDSYSLDACAQRRGQAKNDKVMEYIKDHKLYTQVTIPGKARKEKQLHFDKVPLDIIAPYCILDAKLTREIGEDQLAKINQQSNDATPPPIKLWNIERQLTKTLFAMERKGVKVRTNYVMESWEQCEQEIKSLKNQFQKLSGIPYIRGPKCLKQAFETCNQPFKINSRTKNPIFDKSALANMDSPIANIVKQMRHYEAHIQTYYSSFVRFADKDDIIHANILQHGTTTGRMSCRDPNLQNIPKRDEENNQFPVRACFAPRDGYCFVMIDYNQMEYRMMADYANEQKLIAAINEGEDVHDATARFMGGITRSQAKTINFGLLYGMGIDKLAVALNIPYPEAKALRQKYFAALPSIQEWIKKVIKTVEWRGHIYNWAGRHYYTKEPEHSYKAPNALIQGGCADVVKLAMNQAHDFLEGLESHMLLQIHDELLFEIHKDELGIVDNLRQIMENAYTPFNGMRLTCSVEHSWVSWGNKDRVEGCPSNSTVISAKNYSN